jgi:SAM-dependent methyltransferase
MSATWENLDWEVLDRLRATFLTEAKSAGPYWHTVTDLECYDFTYGERIGWKWDAVLAELKLRGWTPPTGATVLDWGCGSGIAGRRVVEFFGAGNFQSLQVFDHSPLAMEFAQHRARAAFPHLEVGAHSPSAPFDLLVLSHVLNELDADARATLSTLCNRAQAVLWVEPGTHEVSRALGGWRESLRTAGFHVVAPCPHQAACGILAAGNERHWCHFFAAPPPNIYADSGWVRFGQRAGIDLRSLPYSFLSLDRRPTSTPAGFSRIIGEPRLYKGYAKIFNCDAGGVAELMLQKRDAPDLLKRFHKHGASPDLHRWSHTNGRITAVTSAPD